MLQQAFVTLAILYALKKTVDFWKNARSVGNLPGFRTLFTANGALGNFVPRVPGICPGASYAFKDKHSIFEWANCDVVSHVSVIPSKADLVVADAAVIKEITTSRARFPKPVDQYGALTLFGHNIVASEGGDWKKYRKISAPAFSDRNNKLVWDETVVIMNDLFDNEWKGRDVITVDHCLEITLPIALFIIGVAGFGRRMTWEADTVIPKGHKLSFKDSLHSVATFVIIRLILSDRLMSLTEKTAEIALAFEELKKYMTEMIENRMHSEKVERHDLFSSLLDANNEESDTGTSKLTTDELIGNIFIFLLAGHETTAHTLCFTFALLALYPDEQEKLYQHIKSVNPTGRTPTYEEMPLYTQSMAVFYETLRMFSPVPLIPKRSAEDTTLTTTNIHGQTRVIPVPKGTDILINAPGLHYNPKYWEDPHTFKPDRFLKPDWNKDAFLPFSSGARACLGRKFFETEGIAALTMFITRYKITIKEEPQFKNETFEEKFKRITANRAMITLTPTRVPLVFTRRT